MNNVRKKEMMTVLNLKSPYCLTIKTISLMLLASCTIHASDDIPGDNPNRHPHNNVRQHNNAIAHIYFSANNHISAMFGNTFLPGYTIPLSTVIKNALIQQSFWTKQYQLCAEMTELPPKNLIDQLIINFGNRPLSIFTLAIHHQAFFTKDMNEADRNAIIQEITPLSIRVINIIGTYAPLLFLNHMDKNDRSFLIKALKDLTEQQIIEFAKAINDTKHNLFTDDMSGYDISWIMTALAPLSRDQINRISIFIHEHLGSSMAGWYRATIIANLAHFAPCAPISAPAYFSVEQLNDIANSTSTSSTSQ